MKKSKTKINDFILFFQRDFSLTGDYRYIVVKPNEVTYEIIEYTDKTKDLSQSDWDLIKPKEAEVKEDLETNDVTDLPKFKAICIEYSLPTSSYATMALREILKED